MITDTTRPRHQHDVINQQDGIKSHELPLDLAR